MSHTVALTHKHPVGLSAPAIAPPRRGRLVVTLLVVLAGLNLVDLLFTMLAYQDPQFVELNPIADALSPVGRILYKLAAMAVFTSIFAVYRHRRVVLWACLVLLGVYGTIAVIWLVWFPFLLKPHHVERLLACLLG